MNLALLWLVACGPPEGSPRDPPLAATADHLARASMAVRGTRPTEAELTELSAHPDRLEGLVRSWLDSPEFGETVRDQHAVNMHLRNHVVGKLPSRGPVADVPTVALDHALDEAPLRLVEDIVRSGRPYTDVLTTRQTFTNAPLAAIHGLPYDAAGPEWQLVEWADDRPAAGLLSDTALLQRYQSSLSNHHRARGAVVLSAWVCDDLLEASVDIGSPPAIAEPREDTVRIDPSCTTCHATLDPIASAFWGFDRYILHKDVVAAYQGGCPEGAPCYPLPFWKPEEAGRHGEVSMPDPAWKGQPVEGLAGLAQAIVADPAFATCAARRFHGWHTGQHPSQVSGEIAAELAQVLIEANFDARELVVASVLHEGFVAAPARSIRPEELARTVEALTGFRWLAQLDAATGVVDIARNAEHGMKTLLGGTDGWDLLDPSTTPTPSQSMAMDWLASEAAAHAVQHELDLPAEQRTLFGVTAPGPVDEITARAQLVQLHRVVLTWELAPDSPPIDAAYDLFREVEQEVGATDAWAITLSALLQHDRLVLF